MEVSQRSKNGGVTIVKNGCIVTMAPDRRVYSDGAVAFEGQKITAVGPTSDVLAKYDGHPKTEVDGRNMIVMPGFVNGHFHAFNYLIGGHGDDLEISDLLYKVLYPFEKHLTDEGARIGAMASFAEMIRTGITTFNDPGGYSPDAIARAAEEIGIRGIITRSTRDRHPEHGVITPDNGLPATDLTNKGLYDDTETALAEGERFVREWNGAANGRIRAWFGLREAYEATDQLIEGIRDLAEELHTGIHGHVSSVPFENRANMAIFENRIIPRYKKLGVLKSNLYAAHMGDLTESEIEDVAEADAKVAHCCVPSVTGAWGIVKNKAIIRLVKAGVTVSIGVDNVCGSGSMDFFRAMFTFATAHRETHDDPTLIGAHKALAAATIEGARACLWDNDIGSLEIGKRADIILLDPRDEPQWNYPGRDVARNIVYSGNGACVRSAWIDGRMVMRERKILTVDEAGLRRSAAEAAQIVEGRAGMVPRRPWPVY